MTYAQINEQTLSRAHYMAVKRVMEWGKPFVTEDNEQTMELAKPLVIHVSEPLKDPMILKHVGFSRNYMEEYAVQLGHKTKNTFSYTYGNRLRDYHGTDQVINTIAKLIGSPITRRAVMHTWIVNEDILSKNVPCLQTIQYLIRDGKLNCISTFRSNDILMAWGCNAYGLVRLQEHVAESIGTEVGYLETYSISAHVYNKRDRSTLDKVLERYEGI